MSDRKIVFMKRIVIFLCITALVSACTSNQFTKNDPPMISTSSIQSSIDAIMERHVDADSSLVARGVTQVASLWSDGDGTEADFQALVSSCYAGVGEEREKLYGRLAHILEQCGQSADLLNNMLQEPTTLVGKGEPVSVDWIISGYSPMSHFAEDMFANKIAHICVLNFPYYTLDEKNNLGKDWTRQEWAYARMGDVFHTRVPGNVMADYSQVLSQAENYIAGYNIMMHSLRNEHGEPLWHEPMALLSHWNLRDELKSNYAAGIEAREKQEMIYQVMLRIIHQDIPDCVVNNDQVTWYPYSNKVSADGEVVKNSNDLARYQHILNIFHALQRVDAYRKDAPSHVQRTFDEDLEIPQNELKALFVSLLESNEVKAVAAVIRERLRRELRPYDIWYDGFKGRSTISEDVLTSQTQARYPNAKAFENDMARMLRDLGFTKNKATDVASHVVVEAARGSGHARPCVGREQPARLRTRVGDKGMDYKGYNIAVHEFGHNVEEVISLYDMDYYLLAGIPNTGFTEASAFLFQQRDLELLGYKASEAKTDDVFDIIWGMYEIMGVSLVDMAMWKWLYAHPKANAAELRDAVVKIAVDVWNQYYAPILGEENCPLLGIYSHMVGYALYLPGYPIGQIVQYQLEEHLARCETPEEWAKEYVRIYQQGRLTPGVWMQGAVGQPMSVEPILKAVREVVK